MLPCNIVLSLVVEQHILYCIYDNEDIFKLKCMIRGNRILILFICNKIQWSHNKQTLTINCATDVWTSEILADINRISFSRQNITCFIIMNYERLTYES